MSSMHFIVVCACTCVMLCMLFFGLFSIVSQETDHLLGHESLIGFKIRFVCAVCGLFVLSVLCLCFFLVLLSFRLGSKLQMPISSTGSLICFCCWLFLLGLKMTKDPRRSKRNDAGWHWPRALQLMVFLVVFCFCCWLLAGLLLGFAVVCFACFVCLLLSLFVCCSLVFVFKKPREGLWLFPCL